jgi:hypothetical protein
MNQTQKMLFPETSEQASSPSLGKAWPPPVSARALVENPPPTPELLIDGILYRGGTMLVAGPSKARKSYTLIDAAVSIATGLSWLGFATHKTPVLYLNFELQEFAIAGRVAAVSRAKDILPPRDLHFLNLRNEITDLDRLESELPALVSRFSAGAVIIDPHYKISAVSGLEENSNDHQAQLLARFEALCGNAGAAVILAHHFSKGAAGKRNQIDRASGSGVFARWPDVFMTLTDHKEEDAMVFECALRNFPRMDPFVARWKHPLWHRDDGLNTRHFKIVGAGERYTSSEALEKLTDGMTYTAWRDASGMADSTFRRKREDLLKHGRVDRKGDKYYRKDPPELGGLDNRQNSQNSHFNRQDQTTPSAEPAATPLGGGGGGSGTPAPTLTTEQQSKVIHLEPTACAPVSAA